MLVQDERHLGAVHPGRQPLARAHVEHGQRGERPGHVSAGRHLSQLLCVPADAAVVHHLDAGGTGPAEASALGTSPPSLGPSLALPLSPPTVSLPVVLWGDTDTCDGGWANRKFYGASSVLVAEARALGVGSLDSKLCVLHKVLRPSASPHRYHAWV